MSKSLKLIIESLLFSSDRPLTLGEIQACLPDIQKADIKSAIKVLQHEYESMARSFELKEVAKGFQLRSRVEYGTYILRLLQTSPNRLSKAAMETLAIVAYKQPILRHEVELLRGVDVGGILRTLMEKGLIRIVGRKDLPGKPLIYGTTKNFLEIFDLKDIRSLPKLKEIKAFGTDDYEPTPIDEAKEAGPESEGDIPETSQEETAKTETIETKAATYQDTGVKIPETDTWKDTGDESQRQQEQDQDKESSKTEKDREPGQEAIEPTDNSQEHSGTGLEQNKEQEDTGTESESDKSQEFEEYIRQEQDQEPRTAEQDREQMEEEISTRVIRESSQQDQENTGTEQGESEEIRQELPGQEEDTASGDTGRDTEEDTSISGDETGRETAD